MVGIVTVVAVERVKERYEEDGYNALEERERRTVEREVYRATVEGEALTGRYLGAEVGASVFVVARHVRGAPELEPIPTNTSRLLLFAIACGAMCVPVIGVATAEDEYGNPLHFRARVPPQWFLDRVIVGDDDDDPRRRPVLTFERTGVVTDMSATLKVPGHPPVVVYAEALDDDDEYRVSARFHAAAREHRKSWNDDGRLYKITYFPEGWDHSEADDARAGQ